MGRSPSSDDKGLKKGPWTQEEDEKLISHIQKHGHGSWTSLPKQAGLNRCGKSCRLRWTNYLRPDIKRGRFSDEEEQMIIKLHSVLGNKWSRIATHLPGRTDNEVKNYWNTHLRKKLLQMGLDPITHKPRTDLNLLSNLSQLFSFPMNSTIATTIMNNNQLPYDMNALRLQYSSAAELAKLQVLQNIFQILNTSSNPSSSITDHHSAALLGLSSDPNHQEMIEKLLACSNYPGSDFVGASVPTRSETEQGGDIFGSWRGGGISDDARNCLQEMMEMNGYEKGCSSGQQAPAENKLPGLVSVSSVETSSINENMASKPNSNNGSIQNIPDYEFFDGSEKLEIDDGTSDFWKNLLN